MTWVQGNLLFVSESSFWRNSLWAEPPTVSDQLSIVGTFSILYILTFVAVKAGFWGVHIDFTNVESDYYVKREYVHSIQQEGLSVKGQVKKNTSQ